MLFGPFFCALAQSPKKEPIVVEKENKKTPKATSSSDKKKKGHLKRSSLGIGIGQNFLLGDFADLGEDAITFDLFYSYRASYSFDLLINAHFSEQDFNRTEVSLLGLAASIKSHLFHLDSFSPFLLGGLGFYRPEVTRVIDGALVESEAKITFGANAGAGVDLKLNDNYTVGILAQLHAPFRIKQDTQPAVTGMYSKLMLTAFYTF